MVRAMVFICPLLAAGRWFSPGTPGSSTNKTDHHNTTEMLLKMALNTIALTRIKFKISNTNKLTYRKSHNVMTDC
jgi:hypothetical protein